MSAKFRSDKPGQAQQIDTVQVEKLRWSLRQRYRKQWQLMSTDFFDEVDDFLFSSGRSGQLADDGSYLKSMRELRARQALFEEKFLESAIAMVKSSCGDKFARARVQGAQPALVNAAYETVETDLAMNAMLRKAEKMYFQLARQIESLQQKDSQDLLLIDPQAVLEAVIKSFAEAQAVFALPLDTRLLFIKLFEQHFVLKMEKLFQDTISIINNMNNTEFVDKLYSSSSAFRARSTAAEKTVIQTNSLPPVAGNTASGNSAQLQIAADQLVASICDNKQLPEFLERMIRQHWREVIFLIGLHRGSTSVEWTEARHSVSLLATAAAEKLYLDNGDYESIKDHLRRGFSLIQLGWKEQEAFFQALADYFQSFAPHEQGESVSSIERLRKTGLEASISPSGEEILDQEDLDEIAKLLGGSEATGNGKVLEDYLEEVDGLEEQVMVDFMLNGVYVQCLLTRSLSVPGQFTISKRGAKISITRSRLGLALALQSGELRLPKPQFMRSAGPRTVMESSSRTRH